MARREIILSPYYHLVSQRRVIPVISDEFFHGMAALTFVPMPSPLSKKEEAVPTLAEESLLGEFTLDPSTEGTADTLDIQYDIELAKQTDISYVFEMLLYSLNANYLSDVNLISRYIPQLPPLPSYRRPGWLKSLLVNNDLTRDEHRAFSTYCILQSLFNNDGLLPSQRWKNFFGSNLPDGIHDLDFNKYYAYGGIINRLRELPGQLLPITNLRIPGTPFILPSFLLYFEGNVMTPIWLETLPPKDPYWEKYGHPDISLSTLDAIFTTMMQGIFTSKELGIDLPENHTFVYSQIGIALVPIGRLVTFPSRQIPWQYLHREYERIRTGQQAGKSITREIRSLPVSLARVGSHVSLESVLSSSPTKPVQIFLESPRRIDRYVDGDIIEQLRQMSSNAPIFVHGPYTINLCKFTYTQENRLRHELRQTAAFGGKGVVVHVGKALDQPRHLALQTMETNIRKMLPYATPSSPLILETPAGMGTELLTGFEDFAAFYARFENDPRFRICIDTCHVFSSSFDPVEYLREWVQRFPGSCVLIHYNDSLHHFGCQYDRHARPGLGYIGKSRMENIQKIAFGVNIPMVDES